MCRQLREFAGDLGGNFRIGLDQASRRKSVGLSEDDVDAEHARFARRDLIDQLRHPRPRPRPLTVLRETLVVDRDDFHRQRLILARRKLFEKIEAAQPEALHHGGIERAHDHEQRQHHQRRCASGLCEYSTRPAQPSSWLFLDLVLR